MRQTDSDIHMRSEVFDVVYNTQGGTSQRRNYRGKMEQDSGEGVVIKQESVEPVELESRIIELCQDTPKGITDALISRHMPMVTAQQRAMAINRLLSTGRIDVLKGTGGLIYRLKDTQGTSVIKGADNQEKLVYQIITDAGNKGIWIRDIRYKCNIMITQLNKILRNLESKKLIKSVKSVAASKKKVYMLFNLEPDQSVTGGAWFSDQDFESEFVEVLNQQCFKFLQQKAAVAKDSKQGPIAQRNASYASSKEVCNFITELGISKVQLSVADIETILNTLIYDGKVEMTVVASQGGSSEDSQTKLFRAVAPLMQPAGLMRIPCGVCPVFARCHDGGAVSPSSCVYMKDWLDF